VTLAAVTASGAAAPSPEPFVPSAGCGCASGA
jgi:hypothetical protein